jgi:hypothetical protein
MVVDTCRRLGYVSVSTVVDGVDTYVTIDKPSTRLRKEHQRLFRNEPRIGSGLDFVNERIGIDASPAESTLDVDKSMKPIHHVSLATT